MPVTLATDWLHIQSVLASVAADSYYVRNKLTQDCYSNGYCGHSPWVCAGCVYHNKPDGPPCSLVRVAYPQEDFYRHVNDPEFYCLPEEFLYNPGAAWNWRAIYNNISGATATNQTDRVLQELSKELGKLGTLITQGLTDAMENHILLTRRLEQMDEMMKKYPLWTPDGVDPEIVAEMNLAILELRALEEQSTSDEQSMGAETEKLAEAKRKLALAKTNLTDRIKGIQDARKEAAQKLSELQAKGYTTGE